MWHLRNWHPWGAGIAALLLGLAAAEARAQFVPVQQQSVGGVAIDPRGVLQHLNQADRQRLQRERQQALAAVERRAADETPLRKVSLRRLEAAVRQQRERGQALPDEVRFLAGLTRVQYVFVYPEQQDLVLAGPGEGWVVSPSGDVVGAKSGQPVLLLDDLLVALRAARSGRELINCSIDPTAEGLARLQQFARTLQSIGSDPQATIGQIEETLGPQRITVSGVAAESHFAAVLVAADYRMKRLAMKFDEPPVAGLPSFLDLASAGGTGLGNLLPRWWLAASYEPLATDGQGLAWELRGPGVRAVAEEDLLAADGSLQRGSSKASAAGQKWAQNFTERYAALALKEGVFGQLRNCIDLAVVAALVEEKQLCAAAGCPLDFLLDAQGLPAEKLPVPREVDSRASFVKKGRKWLISASGGVQIDPWQVIAREAPAAALGPVRRQSQHVAEHWWWN
jgi:hypothetical protein